jgi:hypothetical protein
MSPSVGWQLHQMVDFAALWQLFFHRFSTPFGVRRSPSNHR